MKTRSAKVSVFRGPKLLPTHFTSNVATRAELPRSEARAALVDLADAVEHRDAIPAFLTMPIRIITKIEGGRFTKALLRRRFRLGAEPGVLRPYAWIPVSLLLLGIANARRDIPTSAEIYALTAEQ